MDVNSLCIVTGGAGFIGSAIVWQLNKLGFNRIIIVDRMESSQKWKNLMPLSFIDILDADEFLDLITKNLYYYGNPNYIFHLGACSSTTETDVDYLLKNNFRYSKMLCGWAINLKAKFIYASSAATYGDGSNGMLDNEDNINKLRPLNAYGFSKSLFDHYIKINGLLPYVVGLKYFNVFGPNENHKGDMRSLANKAFTQIKEKGSLNLFKSYHKDYKDGEQKRDFLYIKDAVDMTTHLAFSNKASGIYNIGSGVANSWNDLAASLFSALKKKKNIKYIDMPKEIKDKYQYYTKADIKKLLDTDYKKKITSLKDAISDYVINYLNKDKYLGDEN